MELLTVVTPAPCPIGLPQLVLRGGPGSLLTDTLVLLRGPGLALDRRLLAPCCCEGLLRLMPLVMPCWGMEK